VTRQSVGAEIAEALARAHQDRAAGRWSEAAHRYRSVLQKTGPKAELFHNLALCALAMADHAQAELLSQRALALNPSLWQSRLLQGKIQRESDPTGERADNTFDALARWITRSSHTMPATEATTAQTLCALERAELHFNVFCDASGCLSLLNPVPTPSQHGASNATPSGPGIPHTLQERLTLTRLIARLYDRQGRSDLDVRAEAADFIRLFVLPKERGSAESSEVKQKASRRRAKPKSPQRVRIGVLSPGLHAGPVYYLCYQTLRALAADCSLVFFQRGTKSDWATEALRSMADEWVDVSGLGATALAVQIQQAQPTVVLELGGWMDIDGLKALALCPEIPSIKWVGGQAMSVGLPHMIGYLSDPWQTPPEAHALYAEPLWEMPLGYVSYTPPPYWPGPSNKKRRGAWGIIGNPLKIGADTLPLVMQAKAQRAQHLRLIDRRYRSTRVKSRVEALLSPMGLPIEWVVPNTHQEFLVELSTLSDVIDTQPYSAGLTAREALSLGATLHTAGTSRLFSSCHGLAAVRQAAALAEAFGAVFGGPAQACVAEAIADRIRAACAQI